MMLCECDQNPPDSVDAALAAFWTQLEEVERENAESGEYGAETVFGHADDARHVASLHAKKDFAESLVRGVLRDQAEIDAELEPFLRHWSLYRLGVVERSVLRLAAWEISRGGGIPPPSAINEAVDIAKFFSETQSGKFVNGVLDCYAKSHAMRSPGAESR